MLFILVFFSTFDKLLAGSTQMSVEPESESDLRAVSNYFMVAEEAKLKLKCSMALEKVELTDREKVPSIKLVLFFNHRFCSTYGIVFWPSSVSSPQQHQSH